MFGFGLAVNMQRLNLANTLMLARCPEVVLWNNNHLTCT
jgi:hypothetical protein